MFTARDKHIYFHSGDEDDKYSYISEVGDIVPKVQPYQERPNVEYYKVVEHKILEFEGKSTIMRKLQKQKSIGLESVDKFKTFERPIDTMHGIVTETENEVTYKEPRRIDVKYTKGDIVRFQWAIFKIVNITISKDCTTTRDCIILTLQKQKIVPSKEDDQDVGQELIDIFFPKEVLGYRVNIPYENIVDCKQKAEDFKCQQYEKYDLGL